MSESHLYPGFRFAGRLESVCEQRRIQQGLLKSISPCEILVVGGGYGEEMEVLLEGADGSDQQLRICAIDLADTEKTLRECEWVVRLGSRFHFERLGLLESGKLASYGNFDLVQCSFVMHDIPHELKGEALGLLVRAIRPGGHLLLSDFFSVDCGDYRKELERLYDDFLREGADAVNRGLLQPLDWRALKGDGVLPGLLRSKSEGMCGVRDFIEDIGKTTKRIVSLGLDICTLSVNQKNKRLAVILACRSGHPSPV